MLLFASSARGRDYDQYDSPRGGRRGPPRDYDDRGPPSRDRDRDDRRDRYDRGPPSRGDRGDRGGPDDWRRRPDDRGERDRDWRSTRGGEDEGGRRWDRDRERDRDREFESRKRRDASPRGKVDEEGFEVVSRRRN